MSNELSFETRNIKKRFGGVQALNGVNLRIATGDVLGLIGPNGAGKTVLVNVISGFEKPDEGEVLLNGENLVGLKPHEIAAKRIARTFQLANLFFENTVKENVLLGLQKHAEIGLSEVFFNRRANGRKQRALEQRAAEILDVMGLTGVENEKARNIPYGLQRHLGVAIALGSAPSLLLLDEPFCGLNPAETSELIRIVRQVSDSGIALLIIEHNTRVIKELCNRVVVLDFGSQIAEGTPSEIQRNDAVIKAYLGS